MGFCIRIGILYAEVKCGLFLQLDDLSLHSLPIFGWAYSQGFFDIPAEKRLTGKVQGVGNFGEGQVGVFQQDNEPLHGVVLDLFGSCFPTRFFANLSQVFGCDGHHLLEAALISQKIAAPVKMVYTREDEMTYGIYRPTRLPIGRHWMKITSSWPSM